MIKFESKTKWAPLLHALLASTALNGCAQDVGAPESETVAPSRDELYRTGTTWPNSVVNVCIDPTDNGGAAGPALVAEAQRVLAASWGKATQLQFKGISSLGKSQAAWGNCFYGESEVGNYSIIALHFCTATSTSNFCTRNRTYVDYDSYPPVKGGYRGYTNNGTANFFGPVPATPDYQPYNVVLYAPGVENLGLIGDDDNTVDGFQTRFRYETIHEFGHAVGFRHEQDRPENSGKASCNPGAGTVNTAYGGDEFGLLSNNQLNDNNSIMSYCASDTLNSVNQRFPVLLSGIDIRGSRLVYQRRPTAHGFMIYSDGDPTLAVNAYGGAVDGGMIRMTHSCTITNPSCTWSYQRGMLVSDDDPTLAIKRVTTSATTYGLRLATAALRDSPVGSYACTPDNPECTWTYSHGEFLLDADSQTYALNARGGAIQGAEVGLGHVCSGNGCCNTSNNSCMWTMPNVMLTSDRDQALPINAYGGANDLAQLVVHQDCTTDNGSCTFTFSRGMIRPTGNANLAWLVYGGSVDGHFVKLYSRCTEDNGACTWNWSHGEIRSDGTNLPINAYNGAIQLNNIVISSACDVHNPDCIFSGFSAKN